MEWRGKFHGKLRLRFIIAQGFMELWIKKVPTRINRHRNVTQSHFSCQLFFSFYSPIKFWSVVWSSHGPLVSIPIYDKITIIFYFPNFFIFKIQSTNKKTPQGKIAFLTVFISWQIVSHWHSFKLSVFGYVVSVSGWRGIN